MSDPLSMLHARMPLSIAQAERLALAMADGTLAPDEITRALLALRDRGESPDEVAGFARALRSLALDPGIDAAITSRAVDIVGTGGDNAGTHNISTASALLVAACDTPVIKHGNRAFSSRSGSADVLAALGLPIPMSPDAARICLERTGFTFLFAPAYHPALARLAPIRRAIATRTIFNVLGPLTNPARPASALIGAYSLPVARLMADALALSGVRRAGVVHSANGLDEATPSSPFTVLSVGSRDTTTFSPHSLHLPACALDDLRGGEAPHNAAAIRSILEDSHPAPSLRAVRDAVVLNAALALVISRGEPLTPETITAQMHAAQSAISDGRAARLLASLREFGAEHAAHTPPAAHAPPAAHTPPAAMGDFLAQMARSSAERCARDRTSEPLAALEARARAAPPPPPLVLSGFDLIAEIKPASPSQGALIEHSADVHELALAQARAYASAGAAIISVLTEPSRFGGSNMLLRAVSAAVPTPTMRKDFLVDPYQVVQARADGASGVLLITRMLSDSQMAEMLSAAQAHALFVLIEAFDEHDIERAARLLRGPGVAPRSGPRPAPPSASPLVLIGLNTRNLADLSVDATRLDRLASHFPTTHPRVAESGMHTPADATRVARLGYDLALVGTALMRSPQPAALCRAMIDAGRAARATLPHA